MTVIEAIDIVRRIQGVGTNVRAETPTGTINGSNKSFTFANERVVPGSVTVTSDGTATTAYTLVEDTGALTMTTAPSSTLVVDYTYIDTDTLDIVEADYDELISKAEAYVKAKTGKYYITSASKTEYFDVYQKDYDLRTDVDAGILEYAVNPTQRGYKFFVKNSPIVNVNKVIVTEWGVSWSKLWSYDGSSYTDNTTEANSVNGDEFELFPTGVVTDYAYLGCAYRFSKFYVDLHTVGVGGAITASYYNGSSWTSVTLTDGTSDLTASGYISFTLPNDFEKTTINSVEAYYLRLNVATQFSTNPKVLQVRIEQDTVIDKYVDLSSVAVYKNSGEIVLRNEVPYEEYRKIRVDYTYGLATGESVPETYKELISVVAAKNLVNGIMGGSFTSETSWNYRGTSATLGEPYTQLGKSLEMLEKREQELLRVVGRVVVMGDV